VAVRPPLRARPGTDMSCSWQFAVSSLAACRLVLNTHQKGMATRVPASTDDSAGIALTTFTPGFTSDDGEAET
jgi:hypothetical protein